MSEKAQHDSGVDMMDWVKWLLVTALVAAAVWGNSHYADESLLYRIIGVLVLAIVAGGIALLTTQGKAFNQLRKDAMIELRKIVWPTRQEALQTTAVVVVFVFIVALILFFIDWILNGLVSMVIG